MNQPPTFVPTSSSTPLLSTLTPTPFQPSSTPIPLAARVNGEGITLSDYQSELARYQAAVGTQLATEDKQRVLQDLIDQVLLAQAASEAGFKVDETTVQDRIDQLISRLGDAKALADWMAGHGYTEASFRLDLARSIAAAWMRDQIAAKVPATAEEVHARQILLYNSGQADQVLAQLDGGKDFAALASEYDPVTNGDLGWFPRGYLMDSKLEEAAFQLQPGEYSDVIQTDTGYHILQVIERDPQHPLAPDARLVLQTKALQSWLETRRSQSEIQILLP